ncbi:MAG: phytanoyl-CoA dioxygenase family protein [Capsulimonadales bacterium]|nr:phytanoyl-CoA dioxygenase family protein [Capsulimonadales bacterium]
MSESAPLPDLSSEYPLTDEQVAYFRENGHVFLPGVCTPEEVVAFAPIITDAAQRFAYPQKPMEERDVFGKAFTLIGGIWNRDENVARFTRARRFARIAARLMGVPGVRLYHDVAINKEPGGGPTPYHQDAYYWPMDTPNTVTMWMPLVDITYEMGGLDFASGSHQAGYLGDGISETSQEYYERIIDRRGYEVVSHARDHGGMRAGDATFHAGWTLHAAPGNPSGTARQVMTVVLYEDGVPTYRDMGNPHREWDFKTYMPGVTPGELAASPLNPVVYP